MLYVNFSFNSRRFVLWLRDLFLRELHTLTILFCLLAYLDEQLITYRNKTFCRVSINLAKLRTRNLLWKRQWIIVIAIEREISCWRWNRHELNCVEDEIVTNWSSCFFLLVDDENECEVYIVRHDENQIKCQRACLIRSNNNKNVNIWFKKQICTWKIEMS